MATVEVLYRVGDAAGYLTDPANSGADGAVLMLRPQGYAWGPAAINNYLTNGTPPANWSSLSNFQQGTIKRMLDRMKWATQPGRTPQEVADIRDPGWDTLPQEQQDTLLADYSAWLGREAGLLFQLQTYGYDTNWSIGELLHFGVVLMDLTDNQILRYLEQSQQRPLAVGLDPVARTTYKAKNWWRVKYEDHLSQAQIDAIADTATLVPVNRGQTPLTPAQVLENL